jgi:ABC-type uncharacterized transport system auxiliary subunit
MKKLNIILFSLVFGLFLTSCIKLRVDNPEIKYYDITNDESVEVTKKYVDCSLQLRTFTFNAKQSADRILVTQDGIVNPLYYHRWVSGFDELISDFIFVRFTKSQTFRNGVLSARTMQTPDYTLEGSIIEYSAVNDLTSKTEPYYIKLTIGIALIKRDTKTGNVNSILTKEYSEKVSRPDGDAFGIHVAYKAALTKIADQMLMDIITIIENDQQ